MLSHSGSQYMDEARTITENFGGKPWTFTISRMRHRHEKTAYVLGQCRPPMDILKQLEPGSHLIAEVKADVYHMASGLFTLTQQDELQFDASKDGIGFAAYRALRDHHAGLGMLDDGEEPGYSTGKGKYANHYKYGPHDGVEAGLEWFERYVNTPHEQEMFFRIIRASNEEEIYPNSSGQSEAPEAQPAAA